MCIASSQLYDQYNYSIYDFSIFTLGMIGVPFMGSHHSGESCVTDQSGHSQIEGGEFPHSRPPTCCGHASAVGRNPPLHLHLEVWPLFFNFRVCALLRPHCIDGLANTLPLTSLLFCIYPCWQGSNSICLRISTSWSKISSSDSVKFRFLPLFMVPGDRIKRWISGPEAYLNEIAYLNEGVDREEFGTSACALNSTLIEMYKRNVLGSMRSHTLIHLNLFVRKTVSGFWRTPSFSMKSTQVLVHEAPGVSFITVAYAQNGAEIGVRDFPRQGCDL